MVVRILWLLGGPFGTLVLWFLVGLLLLGVLHR